MSKKSFGQTKNKRKVKTEDTKIPYYWLNELAGLEINEENWHCHVSIVVESDPDTTVFIEHFNEACQDGLRKEIQVISNYEILRVVTLNFFNKDNAKTGKTPFAVLCDEIYKYLGPNNDGIIPTDMVAALIKYLILQYKDFNIKRRMEILISSEANEEALHKEMCDKLQTIAITTRPSKLTKGLDKLTNNQKSKITRNKSVDKKTTKTKKSTEIIRTVDLNVKATSKLRRRGEEWKDKKWIDDAPEEGPQLYIVISTLHLADLPQELFKLNVPLNSIVKINILPNNKDYNFYSISNVSNNQMQEELLPELKKFRQHSAPYLKTAIKSHFTDEKLNVIRSELDIDKFWKHLQKIIYEENNSLQFKDVMFIQFTPDITKLNFEQASFQGSIYDQISFLLYQLFDYTVYHKQYLNKMEILDIYDSEVCSLQDKSMYKTILDSVPPEFVNIPFVLHAILCQVEEMCNKSMINEENDTAPHDTDTNTSENINILKLKSLLCDLNKQNDLIHADNKQDLLNWPSSEVEVLKILSHSNNIELETFHFKENGQYIEDITFQKLLTTWKYILSGHCMNDTVELLSLLYEETLSECEKYGYDSSNFIYYFLLILIDKEVNGNMFNIKKSFHQIIDEYLHLWTNISSESSHLKNTDSVFKMNYCFHDTDCSIYSEKSEYITTSQTEDSSKFHLNRENLSTVGKKSFLTKYKYFEELCPSDMLQIIQNSYFESNTLQYRCFPCTDQKLLLIYNTLNFKTKFNECYHMTKLRSEVGLRDFVEFILNEENFWIQKLQASYENNIPINIKSFKSTKSHLLSVGSKHFDPSQCEDSTFISWNSLKRIDQPIPTKERLSSKLRSPKQGKKSKSVTKDKSKKSVEIKKKEKGKKSIKDDTEEVKDEVFTKSYDFLGYELGPPIRVQFSTLTKEIFLPHECKLTVNTLKRLYKSESVSVCVAIHGYKLYFHNREKNKNGSFHIYHGSGAIVHFCRKENDVIKELILPEVDRHGPGVSGQVNNGTDQISAQQDEISRKSEVKKSNYYDKILFKTDLDSLVKKDDFEIHSRYNVNLSLPSGLVINIVNEVPGVFYIKQNYLIKGPLCTKITEENYRCLLKNGTVIKYLNNGFVEILCPNSTIYRCKEFEWTNETNVDKDINGVTDEVKQSVRRQSKFEGRKSIRGNLKTKKTPQSVKSDETKIITNEPIAHEGNEETYLISRTYNPIHYDVTHSDGKQTTFKDNTVAPGDTLFLLETNTIHEGVRSVERSDNTELQYFIDGSLLVNFCDGTRITSTVTEDKHELFCDWTESEYLLWFTEKNTDKSEITEKSVNSLSVNVSMKSVKSAPGKTSQNDSSKQSSLVKSISLKKYVKSSDKTIKSDFKHSVSDISSVSEIKTIKNLDLKDEGYIVINMTYTIEHPNYATATYDYENFHLKLPTNISVTNSPHGEYMVELGNEATLTTGALEIIFNHVGSSDSEVLLNNVIHTETFVETDTLIDALCISKDNLGNKIVISRDGNIHQHSGKKFSDSIHKNVEGLNCFVLNNNFSGFKFLHNDEVLKHNEIVMNYGGLHRKYTNIFNSNFTSIPVLSSESEKWVMSYQKNTTAKEINLPSTFSVQNSYLFPFKTKTQFPCIHTELPNTVMIRLIHELPALHMDAINCCLRIFNGADIQNVRAYSKSLPSLHPKTTNFNVSVIKNDPEILISIYEESKKQCENNVALDLLREKEIHYLMRKMFYTIQKLQEKEIIDFMKQSLREHIVPPYFKSPVGQSYDLLFNIINTVVSADKNLKEKTNDESLTLCEKMSFSIPEESVKLERSSNDLKTLCEEMSFCTFEKSIKH